jgi:hypothetical protein
MPRMQGLVARAVLQVPAYRARYLERVKQLRSTVFLPDQMTKRARAIAAKVKPILEEQDKDRAEEQERRLTTFCEAIERRARSIDQQLATPITPLKFDASGTAALAKWESKKDFGRPDLKQEADLLKVVTSEGSSIGTWNSKVWLEPGRYRVEGRVKTKDIVPDIGDSRGGAGLRLARSRAENYIAGTSDWKPVSHEFSVDDPVSEVQIVCEFRGTSGEASFDSLKLSRLPDKK